MKKIVNSIMAVAVLMTFAAGCSTMPTKQTKVKCPKCGSIFTVEEGMKAYEASGG